MELRKTVCGFETVAGVDAEGTPPGPPLADSRYMNLGVRAPYEQDFEVEQHIERILTDLI